MKYTTSIGFVTGRYQVKEHEELFRLADEGLYEAKQLGRNRIHEMKRPPSKTAEGTNPAKIASSVAGADPEAPAPVKH